jgi:hypothetical protein
VGEGISEEAQVCPPKYASIVGVQLDVHNFLVMGARNGDCGGEPYFDRCFDGGQHCISLGVTKLVSCEEMTKSVSCEEMSLRR